LVQVTGAKAIATTMAAHGVEYFFHVSGGMISLFIEIEDVGIDLVLARSEKAAAYMADGYARVSYKPGGLLWTGWARSHKFGCRHS
jgi:acetolactate synthase-1/2/3 large subunit